MVHFLIAIGIADTNLSATQVDNQNNRPVIECHLIIRQLFK